MKPTPTMGRPVEHPRPDLDYSIALLDYINRERQYLLRRQTNLAAGHDFLLQHGMFYPEFAAAPKGIRRIAKRCYGNASRLAMRCETEYFYCEGFAMSDHGSCIAHAWCIDAEARVVEVTWKDLGLVYFGVAFALKTALRLFSELGYYVSILTMAAQRGAPTLPAVFSKTNSFGSNP